jgi:hypothetical protein
MKPSISLRLVRNPEIFAPVVTRRSASQTTSLEPEAVDESTILKRVIITVVANTISLCIPRRVFLLSDTNSSGTQYASLVALRGLHITVALVGDHLLVIHRLVVN